MKILCWILAIVFVVAVVALFLMRALIELPFMILYIAFLFVLAAVIIMLIRRIVRKM